MPKFIKKPIVIEAFQWFPNMGPQGGVEYHPDEGYHIPTPEGNMLVADGDWVITGVEGEKYPCKPYIFDKTYELVE